MQVSDLMYILLYNINTHARTIYYYVFPTDNTSPCATHSHIREVNTLFQKYFLSNTSAQVSTFQFVTFSCQSACGCSTS